MLMAGGERYRLCVVKEPDPVSARMHERTAQRFRNAAARLRQGGFREGEEVAKRIAREEDARAAETDAPRAKPDGGPLP
jgi:hypothetical protein